ncbi:DUF2946 family protein [Piscinibacter sakaiensis]|uniref:DUF2946 domain-containing protein n=1 Tax=Piscinibacter sakaiensis TaxID=1547922 RepID=A0A0K8P7V1_PISS1|nr:DUF2946 family protein [Piscinibacter sakaiensis]GAP38702.1 hypothetical protein ISF6_5255 [Piscinibacter sakaiensis]
MRRRPPLLASCLAVLALLVATLAPALAQAFGTGAVPPTWMEICTSAGTVRLAVPAGTATRPAGGEAAGTPSTTAPDTATPAPQGPGAAHLLEHCPCCLLHADAWAPPPVPAAAPLPQPAPGLQAPAFLHAGRTLDAWVAAPARAPPSRT